jgi:hypothetical protein
VAVVVLEQCLSMSWLTMSELACVIRHVLSSNPPIIIITSVTIHQIIIVIDILVMVTSKGSNHYLILDNAVAPTLRSCTLPPQTFNSIYEMCQYIFEQVKNIGNNNSSLISDTSPFIWHRGRVVTSNVIGTTKSLGTILLAKRHGPSKFLEKQ